MMEITTRLASYKFWNIRWRAAMDVWEPAVGEILIEALRDEAPYDDDPNRDPSKPHLVDQLEFQVSQGHLAGTQAEVEFFGPPLAGLLQAGAPPHPMDGDPLLHFFAAATGDEVFASSVMHPGFEANRFVARAYAKSKDSIFDEFRRTVLAATVVE